MSIEESMEFTEMETDECGAIKAMRRKEFTLHTLTSEILGNLTGNKISIKLDKNNKSLIVFHNDNGFSDIDKKCIRKKYSSNKNGAGINGIGIRVAFDRFSDNERKTIIISKSENSAQKISFLMDKREPSWKVSKWHDCGEEDKTVFDTYSGDAHSGTLFVIPLNEEYFNELENYDIQSLCKRVFNTGIYNGEIDFKYNDDKISVKHPICYDSIELICIWCYYGSNKSNGHRFIIIDNYDELPEIYKSKLFRFMTVTGEQYKNKKNEVDLDESDYNEIETFTAKISNPSNEIFQDILHEYNSKVNETKGVHISLDSKYILEKPILRHSGTYQSFPSNWNPIIEIIPNKNTTLFDLTDNKSTTRETKGDGEKVLKSIWGITKKMYPIPESEPLGNLEYPPSQPISSDEDESMNNIPQDEPISSDEDDSDTPILQEEPTSSDEDETHTPIPQVEDIPPTNISEDINETNLQSNIRNNDDNFSKNEREQLWQDNADWFLKNEHSRPRCPCCDRYLEATKFVAGHIKSFKDGGKAELSNGLAICNRCNNSDTRHIIDMMNVEYGKEHRNTKRLIIICEDLNKK